MVGLGHLETPAHDAGAANGDGNGGAAVSPPSIHEAADRSSPSSTEAAVPITGGLTATANDGVLPHTGGIWSGLLEIGLLLAGAVPWPGLVSPPTPVTLEPVSRAETGRSSFPRTAEAAT